MKSTMIAAGMLTLTALATLPAIASEDSSRVVAHAGVASADKPELLPLPERIRTALANKDAAALWDYLTAPDTPHSERVAAALHWSKFLSLGELAKVRSALAELSKEADIHRFGLEQNPLDCSIAHLPSLAEMPDAERRRVIFGHVWMVPKRRDKYPDDMSQAPWPMQVTVALDRLQGWSINRLVALDNGKPWLDDAMTMPCNTDVQATEYVRRMGRAFVFMGPAHLRRWRDIALNPAFPGAGVEVADALAGGLLSCSGEKRLLGRALYIELLQQRPLTRMTYDLAYYLYSLRTCGSRNDPRRLPLPSPEVMAVAEIAIDRHVTEADRVAYAFAVCEVVDSPPFSSNRQLDRESKEVPMLLRKFEEWYEANKAEFARQAAAEAPLLRDARKKLLDEEMAQGADTAASTPETVFASLVMDISALATKHTELADFTEYVKRQESKLTITFGKNLKPLASEKNDGPVISKRRIRPSDLETNGIFLQFILDDGSNPRQATRQAPLDTVTYFPHLKKTLYAEVVLWQNASEDLRQALEAILEKHKAILSEMNKKAANMDTLGFRREVPCSHVSLNHGVSVIDLSVPTGLVVVHDLNEFAGFQNTYGVQASLPDDLFRTNVLLVLVSPGASGVEIEAVSQRRAGPRPEYYVDAFTSGEDVEIAEPPQGKKHVFVEAVAAPKEVSEGTLYLRFPLRADGLNFRSEGPAIEQSGRDTSLAAKEPPPRESIQDLTRRLAPGGITKEEAAQIANAAYRALWGEPGGELKVTKCELNQAKTWEIEVWWDLGLPNGGARMWIHQTGGFERAEYIPGE